MAQPTTLLGITTDRMDMLIMLGRNGGTDTGHVATGGIIEIRIAEASRSFRSRSASLSCTETFSAKPRAFRANQGHGRCDSLESPSPGLFGRSHANRFVDATQIV
jgi:hypothetical protein